MSGKVAKSRRSAKKAHFRNRNQFRRIRNQISPLMQRVKDLLPKQKAAHYLHILTDVPLSTCQKMLAGNRPENLELVTALLQSDLGSAVLDHIHGETPPAWGAKRRKQLKIDEARRSLVDSRRKIDALQDEVSL